MSREEKKAKKVFKHEPDLWVTVSIDSLTDQRLDYFDRCLLMYMTFRFNFMVEKKLTYFESTQTLADVFGVHRNTVSKAIQKLKEIGYIEVTPKVGGSNTYTKVTTWLNGVTPRKTNQPKRVEYAPINKVQQPAQKWEDTYDCPF